MGNVPLQNREDIRPQIEQAVADFCRAIGYPSDRISSKGPHYRYDYADDPEKSEVQFPHAEEPGCYVFANDSGEILYVGKGKMAKSKPFLTRNRGSWSIGRAFGRLPFPRSIGGWRPRLRDS
jgi:hypothetical protein